ncbi:MAG: type IV pili methyl-accepting chemotaxis transducer N-terminal domain-containing protein [Sedimentitalea sp.]
MKRILTTTAAVLFTSLASVAPVVASNTTKTQLTEVNFFNAFDTEDIGGSQRVEAAALLRVFSQEMAAAACHLQYEVDVDRSRKLLKETKAKFTYLLDALEFGSNNIGIVGAETRRKTLVMIHDLRTAWIPVKTAKVRLLDNPKDVDALKFIKAQNEPILAQASLLMSELASQYSNPFELLQADILLLDFAGRQATKTQKMSKIACEIWAGNKSDDRIELLTEIMGLYELTLNALLDGMPAVGLLAAPNPEIKAHLEQAIVHWTPIKTNLETVKSAGDVSPELKAELFAQLTDEMYHMEALEKMYVKYSKHK